MTHHIPFARSALIVLVFATFLAGCLDDPRIPTGPDPEPAPISTPVTLQILTERILGSPSGHRMHEFQLAIDPHDPNHILMGAVDFDDPNMGSACIVMTTPDGGKTWTQLAIPRNPWIWQFDPWVAIDDQGRMHLTCIELVTQPEPRQSLVYTKSEDSGKTWDAWKDINIQAGNGSYDKIALGVGRNDRVYICGVSDGDYFIAVSKDAGDTWTPTTKLDGVSGNCNGAAEGPDGTLYATHNGRAPSHADSMIGVVASFDGGDTWTVPGGAGPGGGAHISLSIDPRNGDILLGGENGRLYHSTDRGATYREIASAIPDTHRNAGSRIEKATSHVDAQGQIGHLWARVQGEAPQESREIWFTASADQGASWAEPVLLATEEFPSGEAPLNYVPRTNPAMAALALAQALQDVDSPQDLADHAASLASLEYAAALHARGDYWGMASSPDGFLAMWIDHTDRTGISQVWGRIVAATPIVAATSIAA